MYGYEHGGDIYSNPGIRLDFSVNLNPLGMPEKVKEAIIAHIPDYGRYPDPACRELKAALGDRQGLSPDKILPGNGASELIFALCAALQPRRVLLPAPTFSEYQRAAQLFGGEINIHPLREEEGFSLTEEILAALTPDVEMLFLCNPNNPTGRLIPPMLLAEIAKHCRSRGILLVLDECFIDFTRGESLLPQMGAYPNLFILQAFTKLYTMAGLRLGMLYGADRESLAHIARHLPAWSVSAVAQAAGLAALEQKDWIETTKILVEEERDFMTAALSRPGLTIYAGEGNFLLLKSAKPLYEPLLKRGILVRCCENFSGLDKTYIRIGLKTHEENLALLRALEEVWND